MDKKIVHYRGDPIECYDGRAMLLPVDHPDTENVSNEATAITSKIISWDKETGVIETKNTIYKPEAA